jgi:hypothetical protein
MIKLFEVIKGLFSGEYVIIHRETINQSIYDAAASGKARDVSLIIDSLDRYNEFPWVVS